MTNVLKPSEAHGDLGIPTFKKPQDLPSGKRLQSYGKSLFSYVSKSTISMGHVQVHKL